MRRPTIIRIIVLAVWVSEPRRDAAEAVTM